MLSLLNLLADSGRVPTSGVPEPVRNASAEGDFESLFAVAAGFSVLPGPPPPVSMGAVLEQPSQPPTTGLDPEVSGSGLPGLPAQRQAVAGPGTPASLAMPQAEGPATAAPGGSTASTPQAPQPGPYLPANPDVPEARPAVVGGLDRSSVPQPAMPTGEPPPAAVAEPVVDPKVGRRPLQAPQGLQQPVLRELPVQSDAPASGPVAKTPDTAAQGVDTSGARPPAPASLPLARNVTTPQPESQPVLMPAVNTPADAPRADPIVPRGQIDGAAGPAMQQSPDAAGTGPARSMEVPDRLHTNADRSTAPQVAVPPDRSPAGGAAALAAALHSPGSGGFRGVADEASASVRSGVRPTVRSPEQIGQQGLLPESARVRQAAEVMREWGTRTATAEATTGDGPAALRHGPAPASSAPAPQALSASALPDPGTLSLADTQAAAEQLVQRMLQGQARNLSSVRFQLSPAELGHLEVHLQQRGDRLEVRFTASHPAARDLIDSALPNLRALLQDVGVQLGDVDVRHESAGRDGRGGQAAAQSDGGQGDGRGRSGGSPGAADGGAGALGEEGTSQVGSNRGDVPPAGSIDAYA